MGTAIVGLTGGGSGLPGGYGTPGWVYSSLPYDTSRGGSISGGGYAASSLAGGTTDYSSAYGGKPTVPSPAASAAAATSGNLSNLSSLIGLGAEVNPATATQFYGNIPNYTGLNQQSSENIGAMLRGEVPQDVANQIAQRAAERGVITGQTSPASYLQALGLNSLQMQQQGEALLGQSVARNTRAPFYAPASGFISPDAQQSAQMAANIYQSAPVPSAANANALRSAQNGLNTGYRAAAQPFAMYSGGGSGDALNTLLQSYAPHLFDTGNGFDPILPTASVQNAVPMDFWPSSGNDRFFDGGNPDEWLSSDFYPSYG
jgi:hypothetical protein